MRISELIDLLTREQTRLGDRELLEGVTFGSHRPILAATVLDGNHLGYPEQAVMFLQASDRTDRCDECGCTLAHVVGQDYEAVLCPQCDAERLEA